MFKSLLLIVNHIYNRIKQFVQSEAERKYYKLQSQSLISIEPWQQLWLPEQIKSHLLSLQQDQTITQLL